MKVNEVGTEVKFKDVANGAIIWFCGDFFIKTIRFYDDIGEKFNVVCIEDGDADFVQDESTVTLYKNASLNLV